MVRLQGDKAFFMRLDAQASVESKAIAADCFHPWPSVLHSGGRMGVSDCLPKQSFDLFLDG